MSPADTLRDFISPLLQGWRIQFGRWTDGSNTDRYCVIKPVGGLPLELVRRPNFTLTFVGADGQPDQVPLTAAMASLRPSRPTPSTPWVCSLASLPSSPPTTDAPFSSSPIQPSSNEEPSMEKYIGKSFAFAIAIAAQSATPTTGLPLGAMRDKSIGFSGTPRTLRPMTLRTPQGK